MPASSNSGRTGGSKKVNPKDAKLLENVSDQIVPLSFSENTPPIILDDVSLPFHGCRRSILRDFQYDTKAPPQNSRPLLNIVVVTMVY
jgi:hypothetical protein